MCLTHEVPPVSRARTGTCGRGLIALHQGVLCGAWREERGDGGRLAACGVAQVCYQEATVELCNSRSLG